MLAAVIERYKRQIDSGLTPAETLIWRTEANVFLKVKALASVELPREGVRIDTPQIQLRVARKQSSQSVVLHFHSGTPELYRAQPQQLYQAFRLREREALQPCWHFKTRGNVRIGGSELAEATLAWIAEQQPANR